MKPAIFMFPVTLLACGRSDVFEIDARAPDDGYYWDTPGCELIHEFTPQEPVAGENTTVHVTAALPVIPADGPADTFRWRIRFNGAAIDFTWGWGRTPGRIDFRAPNPGTYDVRVDVPGSPFPCGKTFAIHVRAAGPRRSELLRMRIVSPRAHPAPAFEKTFVLYGDTSDLDVVIDPGVVATPTVRGPDGVDDVVPAYLKFSPSDASTAVVEAFSDALGRTTTRLGPGPYTVVIVPSVTGVAPGRILDWSPSMPTLDLPPGTPTEGVVSDPSGAPLRGAKVQLSIDGVPSTLATTAEDGSFTLLAVLGSGEVVVDIAPPDASGLPRLRATSAALDLREPLQIRYATSLTRRDLAGTTVEHRGTRAARASVIVVGTLPAAGTVTTAETSAGATGEVRIAVITDAVGALPTALVPAAELSAVVTSATGDLAVVPLDTTAEVPRRLDAPPMKRIAVAATDVVGYPLPGAVLDLVPIGALALAKAPTLRATADDLGFTHAAMAAGGHYDLWFRDPAARAAPVRIAVRDAATLEPIYPLPPGLRLSGTVSAGTQPLDSASIQILCETCRGLDRTTPIAESVSDASGRFVLAIPEAEMGQAPDGRHALDPRPRPRGVRGTDDIAPSLRGRRGLP